MRAIYNETVDPYFNIASEEYLMDSSSDDVFMLWRNSPSVIIGKNQNAWAEIDVPFVKENGIAVVRRITGGGAVFHDLGNVNFTFITRADDDTKLNFAKFTKPITDALSKVGVASNLDGRNDIVAEGYKISGNAECVRKNMYGDEMILHHGTLLFDADISKLAAALRVCEKKIESKGIKSVSSRVKNIAALDGYRGPKDVEDFISLIMNEISDCAACSFTEEETAEIEILKAEKFATWEWNFGTSPAFETEHTERFPFGTLTASFTCRGGHIESIRIFGDFFGTEDVARLEELLTGVKLEYSAVKARLDAEAALCAACIDGVTPDDIASLITNK